MLYKNKKYYIVANSNGISLRDGPDTRMDILYNLQNDTEVYLLEHLTDGHLVWGHIQFGGRSGWAVLEDLRTNAKNFKSKEPQRNITVVTPKYRSRRNKKSAPEEEGFDVEDLEELL